jgi:copper resistance protein B
MKHLPWLSSAMLLIHAANGAEDHSAHQHHPTSESLPQEHAPDEHKQVSGGSEQESQAEHVAPPGPTLTMDGMSDTQMNELMEMNDNAAIGMLLVDQAEWRRSDGNDASNWDVSARYGTDFHKIELRTEGEHANSATDSSNELRWNEVVSRWWWMQAGIRHDTHDGPSRTWVGFGVHGLATNWFDVDANVYVGEQGRLALKLTSEYELLRTQRWILQPRLELNAYGARDRENVLGSGIADAELGFRLRYEIRREFGPYAGLAWRRLFGDTASLAERSGTDRSELEWLAGVRIWF